MAIRPSNFLAEVQRKKQEDDESSLLSRYEVPLVTVDIVLFTVEHNQLKVLLIQRKNAPFVNMWAIPGGFIHADETLEEAASRRLFEETNVNNIYLKQFASFGEPNRDPRCRVITVAYYALVSANKLTLEAHANAQDIRWYSMNDLPELAFDHAKVIQRALSDLRRHVQSTPLAFQLLPEKFTLTELQRVYELILDKPLDKRNFRKKMLATQLLVETAETKMDGFHRPAQLYAFLQNESHSPEALANTAMLADEASSATSQQLADLLA